MIRWAVGDLTYTRVSLNELLSILKIGMHVPTYYYYCYHNSKNVL